jgi:outer membrane protein OmpA-like peptidoglycan-associated protein
MQTQERVEMKRVTVFVMVALLLASFCGCSSWKKRDKGALIGAGAGAAIGAVIGHEAGNTAVGAILGAAIGGAAGAYIGNYMDKQAEEIERDLEGARVERVGEGIKITFASGILFDINQSSLRQAAKSNLGELAVILNKYEDTEVLVEGHTDSTGGHEHNLDLSIRRSQSVANYMTGLNVLANRFRMMGYGEDQPIASNDTPDGRQANRRVEIAIFANDKLKDAARAQTEG